MNGNINLKVGDKIVDFGKVYKIYQIKKPKRKDAKKRIFFRRYYDDEEYGFLEFSLPIDNVNMTDIRKPLSKNGVKKLLTRISKSYKFRKKIDTNKAKDMLKGNEPKDTIKVLKNIYAEKFSSEGSITKSRKRILEKAFKKIEEEFALVLDIEPKKARERITKALNKSIGKNA